MVANPVDTPENMAETLRLAFDAQQAAEKLAEVQPTAEASGEEAGADVRYKISPKKGTLTTTRLNPDGEKGWLRTDETGVVSADNPFVATHWTFSAHGSHGMEFTFYTKPMQYKDGKAEDVTWELRINAKDLDGLKIVEESQGEAVSEWIGRHAVFGAAEAAVA